MKILIGLAVVFSYILIARLVTAAVKKAAIHEDASPYRIKYINKTLHLILGLVFVTLFVLSLGIHFTQLSLFLSSVFAVIGVALFAQWSMLSNITASLIIFFAFPYRVGDTVKVVDNDDDISGTIEEISLFHVIIRREQDLITYPNNLILQKAVIKRDASKDDDLESSNIKSASRKDSDSQNIDLEST